MNFTDTPLLSLVRNKIKEFVRFTSQETVGVYINEVAHAATERYGDEIADALFEQDQFLKKHNNPDNLVVKQNHYNLMMHNERRKYKLWLGVTAKIAEENHKTALQTWPDEMILQRTRVYKGDGYYIESIPYIKGFTLREVFCKQKPPRIDEFRNIDAVTDLVAEFVDRFYNVENEQYPGLVTCCLDLLPDNVVLPLDQHQIQLIDFDHIVFVPRNYMLDKLAERFFEYPFKYEDISCHPWWLDHRSVFSQEEIVATLRNKLK